MLPAVTKGLKGLMGALEKIPHSGRREYPF